MSQTAREGKHSIQVPNKGLKTSIFEQYENLSNNKVKIQTQIRTSLTLSSIAGVNQLKSDKKVHDGLEKHVELRKLNHSETSPPPVASPGGSPKDDKPQPNCMMQSPAMSPKRDIHESVINS